MAVCPWLSRDALNNEMRRRASSGNALIDSVRANQITTSVADLVVARNTGGRPGGSSDAKKRNVEKVVIAAKNELCEQYNKDKSNVDVNKKLPRGHLTNIISRVKRKYELGHDINITVACICQRFKKSRLIVESARPGPSSPLNRCENEFVKVLIQMARMRQALSPSQGVDLINSLIEGTQVQKELVAWKK